MIKAVFFDSSNVLVTGGYKEGIEKYEQKYSIQANELLMAFHDHQHWLDFTLGLIDEEEFFTRVKEKFTALKVTELKKMILDTFKPNIDLIDYIRELKGKYITGVISNNPKEWFEYFDRQFGYSEFLKIKVVSGYLHIRKPNRMIFQRALEMAGVSGEECLYIDDRPDRVQGAEELGMKIIEYKRVAQLQKQINKLLVG
jgi:putative hydrolase of the HAD superfamily